MPATDRVPRLLWPSAGPAALQTKRTLVIRDSNEPSVANGDRPNPSGSAILFGADAGMPTLIVSAGTPAGQAVSVIVSDFALGDQPVGYGSVVFVSGAGPSMRNWYSDADGGTVTLTGFDGGELSLTATARMVPSIPVDGGAGTTFTVDVEFVHQTLYR